MNALILRISARYLSPILIGVSVLLLLRGHNDPGGGFIGGLLAASAMSLLALAHGTASARRSLRVDPRTLIAVGLLLALTSGFPALFGGREWLTGMWTLPELPLIGAIPLGTPLWFDVGIYISVVGFTLTIVFALSENDEEEAV
ncbi:MAG: Na+/H+ antiporter subunit B [Bacteroidetes bacterium]|nr:Na+/H+ antiporter subunit B [Bacteroidota bacterium]